MSTRALGPFQVSPIGLGCMNICHAYGNPPSPEQAERLLLTALDAGVTHFRAGLTHLAEVAEAYDEAKENGGVFGPLKKLWHGSRALVTFVRLYFMPVQQQAVLADPRLQPTW